MSPDLCTELPWEADSALGLTAPRKEGFNFLGYTFGPHCDKKDVSPLLANLYMKDHWLCHDSQQGNGCSRFRATAGGVQFFVFEFWSRDNISLNVNLSAPPVTPIPTPVSMFIMSLL